MFVKEVGMLFFPVDKYYISEISLSNYFSVVIGYEKY